MYTTICMMCHSEWDQDCEQGVSVEWHGQCITCKFTPQGQGSNDGTDVELAEITEEAKKRTLPFRECPPITDVADWIKYNIAEREYKETLLHIIENDFNGRHVSLKEYLTTINEYDIDVYEEYIVAAFHRAPSDEVLTAFYKNESLKEN